MVTHTVTGPLRLADPAPVEVALRTCAHHMHAATYTHRKNVLSVVTAIRRLQVMCHMHILPGFHEHSYTPRVSLAVIYVWEMNKEDIIRI
jgi:hypothetical protein